MIPVQFVTQSRFFPPPTAGSLSREAREHTWFPEGVPYKTTSGAGLERAGFAVSFHHSVSFYRAPITYSPGGVGGGMDSALSHPELSAQGK